jgi:FkbM family methyltransferase
MPVQNKTWLPAPAAYVINRGKDVLRGFVPAHRRFVRSGEAFLRAGEREVHLLPQLVQPGSIAVDVGAHIGDYTYSLCRCVGPGGRVIAVEPIADLATMLQRATQTLGFPVTVHQCALSSQTGEADLFVPTTNGARLPGLASLQWGHQNASSQRVCLSRLDDICGGLEGRVSFIKIDVEGHELDVLRGGTNVLNKHRPNLLVEIEQRHSASPIEDTFECLASFGYCGEFLDARGDRQPLSRFDIEEHQLRPLAFPDSAVYVNNFIFRPQQQS